MMDGIPADNICVIPNMIDESFPAYHVHNKGFRVLFVGNSAWWRDIDTVNKLSSLDGVSVGVVGNGWNDLSSDIDQMQIPYFEMPFVYARSDVLVAPYHLSLPISRCIIEALMSGLPVVATGNNSVSPVVKHMVNGLLFENNIDFLDGVCLLRDNRSLYKQLHGRARSSVFECCSPDVLVHDYIQVYEEVCA
jgi:glycosyltransferase involved in cell wall biosynthesis